METLRIVLPYLIGLSMVAVLASLFGGLASMSRGGDFNARWGNRLMRWRVISQGVALALIGLYFVLTRLV
jgi:hypothetical protein